MPLEIPTVNGDTTWLKNNLSTKLISVEIDNIVGLL